MKRHAIPTTIAMILTCTLTKSLVQALVPKSQLFSFQRSVPVSRRIGTLADATAFLPSQRHHHFSSTLNKRRIIPSRFLNFRRSATIGDNSIGQDIDGNGISNSRSDEESLEAVWYDDAGNNELEEEEDHLQSDNENETPEEEEDDDDLSNLYNRIRSSVDKSISSQTKKQNALQKELDKAKSLESIMSRANLIISNLYQLPAGTETAIVQSWDDNGECHDVELVLDTDEYNSAQEEADALFASARKMKRGSAVVGGLILETEMALEILDDAILDLDFALEEKGSPESGGLLDEGRINLILDRLERTSKQTGFVLKKEDSKLSSRSKPKSRSWGNSNQKGQHTFRKFLSPGGCVVLVGRNRRDNEAICFQVSRGDDVWMHSRGCPGAHVLLQIRRGSPRPTEECFQFAANLAAFYSDARTERKAPVTTASPKHIQKPRGAPLGAVKLRQELNTLTGYPANVDDELKIAREKSGVVWDESGSRSLGGKAKNRKKTQANAQQISAKKRADKKASKRKRRQNSSNESSDFW